MEAEDVLKPLAVFVVVVVLLVVVTAIVSFSTVDGTGAQQASTPDGQQIDGQSPAQFQPESLEADVAPEGGEISVEETNKPKRILVDNRHGNQFSPEDFEPLTEALFEANHTVVVSGDRGERESSRPGTAAGYNATLEKYDAVIVIQPTTPFTPTERAAVREYTEKGGRLLVMGEPGQIQVGRFGTSTVSFGADNLTHAYGVHLGAETLYNLDESANDNNFKSIYASPAGGGALTEGVDTVTFDSAGHVVVREDSEARVLFRAEEGTTTLQTRRTARYPTVARNGNVAFVADSSFLDQSELYDLDNDVFVSNLLNFLVEGERPDLVEDEEAASDDPFGTPPTSGPEQPSTTGPEPSPTPGS